MEPARKLEYGEEESLEYVSHPGRGIVRRASAAWGTDTLPRVFAWCLSRSWPASMPVATAYPRSQQKRS